MADKVRRVKYYIHVLSTSQVFIFYTHELYVILFIFDVILRELDVDSVGGAVASWSVRSSLERVVRVRALAGDIVLCSWARHLTLTVPLSTQVYKWVPVNCWGKPNKIVGE